MDLLMYGHKLVNQCSLIRLGIKLTFFIIEIRRCHRTIVGKKTISFVICFFEVFFSFKDILFTKTFPLSKSW